MSSIDTDNPREYLAIVFTPAADTEDFSTSEPITLPGIHTEREAWEAVRAALREGRCIGGEVLRT